MSETNFTGRIWWFIGWEGDRTKITCSNRTDSLFWDSVEVLTSFPLWYEDYWGVR